MQYHFLHLSDLHFRSNWQEEVGLVTTRFLEDLATQKAKFPNPYLIFSGDVVQAGGEARLYTDFESRFNDALTQAGFPFERRVCIPGNHDISRPALKDNVTLQQGVLGVMTDERTFNDNLRKLSTQALATFDPVWGQLSPKEQARVMQLLVERVAYDGKQGTVSITFHASGIKTLAGETHLEEAA